MDITEHTLIAIDAAGHTCTCGRTPNYLEHLATVALHELDAPLIDRLLERQLIKDAARRAANERRRDARAAQRQQEALAA
ncbi:hypothetical protein [Marisediminicola senii]|uniref:hypothetical protein n=1 Tax=Marisediminicola senii TaxID=2711233 RepID=UPI0013E9F5AA|nr:hypothetical protein [Marisediminicola senii]